MPFKRWRPFRDRHDRKRQEMLDLFQTAGIVSVNAIMRDLRHEPVTVKHVISRTIPRPMRATMIAENVQGQRYQQSIDMSYKDSVPVTFPVQFFTGRDSDISLALVIRLILDYDPKDRS